MRKNDIFCFKNIFQYIFNEHIILYIYLNLKHLVIEVCHFRNMVIISKSYLARNFTRFPGTHRALLPENYLCARIPMLSDFYSRFFLQINGTGP